jgi:heme/copper-type cytochrome/quinol oxidase subunit 3
MNTGSTPSEQPMHDPVRVRRAQVAKWTLLANRVGYLFYAVAISVFVMAFAMGFKGPLVTVVTASLIIGSVLLAPSIVLGYAVKAAEREDRERGL